MFPLSCADFSRFTTRVAPRPCKPPGHGAADATSQRCAYKGYNVGCIDFVARGLTRPGLQDSEAIRVNTNAPMTLDGKGADTHAASCSIYTDGGARGNPGPAAAAGVIIDARGEVLAEVTDYLGETTNNVAEYKALILTLRRALELGCARVAVKMDSELVVKQIAGLYRVKDAKMVPLHAEVRRLLGRFESQSVEHVSRASNKHADKLVNAVLDARDQTLRERAQ